MRDLHIDFQRAHKPAPWLGLALLLAAVIPLAVLAAGYQSVSAEMRFWEAKVDHAARLSGRRAPVSGPLNEQAARAQALEVKQANAVVRQLGLPWNLLFNAVESAERPDVALLSLEPDLQNGMIRIGAEAKDFDALLAYLKELSTRDVFGSVMLQSHQIQREIAERPVRFSLVASWKGGVAP